jgi:hypothetical protein
MRDTIDMAREAGLIFHALGNTPTELKAFEALVRKDECEACAYWAGIALLGADRGLTNRVGQAIRAKGNK